MNPYPMNNDILSQYDTAQYLLAIEPPEALRTELQRIKKEFSVKYDCPGAVQDKPRLGLIRFEQFAMNEARIIRKFSQLLLPASSFMVELHDFAEIPTHSICFGVTTYNRITELVQSLRPVQAFLKIDKDRKPHFIQEPHFFLARKLLPWQFEKGWLEYSHTHFSGKFMADQLVLLRRKKEENRYETLQRFPLKAEKLLEVKQGLLW
jgi:2'-5' RNA ligase